MKEAKQNVSMSSRRKVLIGLGGSIAIAGCTGETDEEEPEEEPEPDPNPAFFEITDIGESGYINYHPENPEVDFSATIENTGDEQDTQSVEFQVQDITTIEEELTLDGGETGTVRPSPNLEDGKDDTYQYSYHTEDEERVGGDIFIFECPAEDELPEHNPIDADDVGYDDIERADIHVRLLNEGDSYDDSELIQITKHVVCSFTIEYDWHAISATFWEQGQSPGFEQAYGECNWAPNGIWSQADEVELGDYSTHEYSVRRF